MPTLLSFLLLFITALAIGIFIGKMLFSAKSQSEKVFLEEKLNDLKEQSQIEKTALEKQLQQTIQEKEGIQLVFNKVRSTLQSKGVTPMESLHKDFNVELHEAITEIPVTDNKQKGKVVDEITKGYFLNDKIIRFAKVVVGK